jgi:hypothetical protein
MEIIVNSRISARFFLGDRKGYRAVNVPTAGAGKESGPDAKPAGPLQQWERISDQLERLTITGRAAALAGVVRPLAW